MNIPQFIQKYSLFKTFCPSDLNDIQLKELESCTEFADVKKFNSVSSSDDFFIKNAIDFPLTKLKSNTRFNYRLNLHSISVIGPFPESDMYKMKEGVSQFKYVDAEDFKHKAMVIYKFDYEKMQEKFLSQSELKNHVANEIVSQLENGNTNHEYYYFIGIRTHKDSVCLEIGHGTDVKILADTPDTLKLF